MRKLIKRTAVFYDSAVGMTCLPPCFGHKLTICIKGRTSLLVSLVGFATGRVLKYFDTSRDLWYRVHVLFE